MDYPDFGGKIVTFEDIDRLRPTLGRIVTASGGFDPVHPGHISCFIEGKQYGDTLVVIVNGDSFLERKKGKAFQDLATRMLIVSALPGVDYVVPFISDQDGVGEALDRIRPRVFVQGGDRNIANIPAPEVEACERHGIEVIGNVGLDKRWSSSDFLHDWEEHALRRRGGGVSAG